MAYESPLSKGISNWWSDCYGEGPRMFYHAFAGVPEWAPPGENHILYSESVLKHVSYKRRQIQYTATGNQGVEFLRITFKPAAVTLEGKKIPLRTDLAKEGYTLRDLGKGDYALTIKRGSAGSVAVSGE
jgi:hypothetical protein